LARPSAFPSWNAKHSLQLYACTKKISNKKPENIRPPLEHGPVFFFL
jgi:hypothetical protein